MKSSACLLFAAAAVLAVAPLQSGRATEQSPALTADVRGELLHARDVAWRSFFQKDATVVEQILGPELIAIQQSSERWQRRDELIAMARTMSRQGVQLRRLEFPQTEIQLFGDTAILYYTYLFETALADKSATDVGRGTEVFVRRDGRWVDVGWHLDNGAFSCTDGQCTRIAAP